MGEFLTVANECDRLDQNVNQVKNEQLIASKAAKFREFLANLNQL